MIVVSTISLSRQETSRTVINRATGQCVSAISTPNEFIDAIAQTLGTFALGVYMAIRSQEHKGIPATIEHIATRGNVSRGKVRATCQQLAEGGWIVFSDGPDVI